MQDIRGLRVIVDSVDDVRAIHARLMRSSESYGPYKPASRGNDYIAEPKPDGYRSIHQVFRLDPEHEEDAWCELLVEVQIRTRIQHAWATAVETLGAMEATAFKLGEGETDLKRFLFLASGLLSIIEGEPVAQVLRDMPPRAIVEEFLALEARLGVFERLEASSLPSTR